MFVLFLGIFWLPFQARAIHKIGKKMPLFLFTPLKLWFFLDLSFAWPSFRDKSPRHLQKSNEAILTDSFCWIRNSCPRMKACPVHEISKGIDLSDVETVTSTALHIICLSWLSHLWKMLRFPWTYFIYNFIRKCKFYYVVGCEWVFYPFLVS